MIDTVAPWSVGGREIRYEALLSRMAAHDLEITVYTMKWWGTSPRGPVRYRAITPKMPLYKGDRRSILQGVVFALGTVQLLFRRFDVIEADHMPYLHLFPLRVIAWIRRVDLVVDWHEYWGTAYWARYLGRPGSVAAALERAATKLPDVVVPVTDELASDLASAGVPVDRIVTIPNAVDRARLEAVSASDTPCELLVVGRLVPHKRVDLALQAFALLGGRLASARLGIVGQGPERERLEGIAADLGVTDRVTFFGAVPRQEDVWSLMKGAYALLVPSEREGFGLVVAESLALGTPVVCFDAPESRSRLLVTEGVTGSVVPDGSATSMAASAQAWLERSRDAATIVESFWRLHPDLDWEVSAARYARLLAGESTTSL